MPEPEDHIEVANFEAGVEQVIDAEALDFVYSQAEGLLEFGGT